MRWITIAKRRRRLRFALRPVVVIIAMPSHLKVPGRQSSFRKNRKKRYRGRFGSLERDEIRAWTH